MPLDNITDSYLQRYFYSSLPSFSFLTEIWDRKDLQIIFDVKSKDRFGEDIASATLTLSEEDSNSILDIFEVNSSMPIGFASEILTGSLKLLKSLSEEPDARITLFASGSGRAVWAKYGVDFDPTTPVGRDLGMNNIQSFRSDLLNWLIHHPYFESKPPVEELERAIEECHHSWDILRFTFQGEAFGIDYLNTGSHNGSLLRWPGVFYVNRDDYPGKPIQEKGVEETRKRVFAHLSDETESALSVLRKESEVTPQVEMAVETIIYAGLDIKSLVSQLDEISAKNALLLSEVDKCKRFLLSPNFITHN